MFLHDAINDHIIYVIISMYYLITGSDYLTSISDFNRVRDVFAGFISRLTTFVRLCGFESSDDFP